MNRGRNAGRSHRPHVKYTQKITVLNQSLVYFTLLFTKFRNIMHLIDVEIYNVPIVVARSFCSYMNE